MSYSIDVAGKDLDLDEVIEFLSKIFGPNYYSSKHQHQRVINSEPSTTYSNFVLAKSKDGSLIGLIRLVERSIRLRTQMLSCAGISSVSVRPDRQGEDIGRRMLAVCEETASLRGKDLLYLYGRRNLDGYYTQEGYHGINRYMDIEILSSIERQKKLRLIPITREGTETASQLYENQYNNLSGSVMRDMSVWNFIIGGILDHSAMGVRMYLLPSDDGATPDGYLVIVEDRVVELSAPQEMFRHIVSTITDMGVRYVSIHPFHPFTRYLVNAFNTITHTRYSLDGGYMGKIADMKNLLVKLAPDLSARAKMIGRGGEIVRLLGHEVNLSTGVVQQSAESMDIEVTTQANTIALLLGLHGIQELYGVGINPEKPWIQCLFSSTGFHTSALDEI